MKRWMWSVTVVTVIVVAVQVLSGCGSAADPPQPATMKLGAEANGSSKLLAHGQMLEISLAGNPTTGYSWTAKEGGAPVLRSSGEPVYTSESTDATLVGGGGTYTFSFEGAESGTTRLELEYHRAWETGVAPLESFTLDVTVE